MATQKTTETAFRLAFEHKLDHQTPLFAGKLGRARQRHDMGTTITIRERISCRTRYQPPEDQIRILAARCCD
jgi:hypothetical protein